MLLKTAYEMKPPVSARINHGHPLVSGLVGWWSLNENSGGKIFDSSGYGRNGVAVGTTSEITWQSVAVGTVVNFRGDQMAAFQFSSINFTDSDSWTIIVRCQTDEDVNEGILLGTYDALNDWIWFIEGTGIRFMNSAGAGTNFISVTKFGAWATYAFVAKGDGELHLYVNGIFSQTRPIATSFIIDSIGCALNSHTYAFDGRVGYCGVYNRALSASEIALHDMKPYGMFGRRGMLQLGHVVAGALNKTTDPRPKT